MKRIFTLLLALLLLASSASAEKKAKPTNPPREITEDICEEVPEQIQALLQVAHDEWIAGDGKELKKENKYTNWNGSHGGYGWCGGFITWCTLQVDIPQKKKNDTPRGEVEGVVHVHEAGQGKLVDGYERMNRLTTIPQKGFIIVYGNANKNSKFGGLTKNYHVGLVYDVEKLPNGKYRITTIEGNVSTNFTDSEGVRHKVTHTIRMYIRDYDPRAEKPTENLTLVPEEERTQSETPLFSYGYTYNNDRMYVARFLMTWIPE